MAKILENNQSTVVKRSRQLGMVSKTMYGCGHELTDKNLIDQAACNLMLKRNKIESVSLY